MKKYLIEYNTGAGNEYAETINEAKEMAKDGCAYTQENIDIVDTETGNVVSTARWYGIEPGEDEEILERFGDSGYYAPWVDLD